jgi:aspartyl-tRNA(Asn)/glutamyl-tRNA(Gln) amidotransferase subunit B
LLPLIISEEWIAKERSEMAELPADKSKRWQVDFGLSAYDCQVLTQERTTADFYESLVAELGKDQAKAAANLMAGEFASALNRDGILATQSPLSPKQIAKLIVRISDGTISNKIAKEIFIAMWDEKTSDENAVDRIIDAKGLRQISDTGALEAIIDQVLAANQKSVEEFRAGKEKAFNSLIGQCMKATQGKANPQQVNKLLTEKLG